ncbi:MAG: CoA transferase [Gammaproteobacteria bacterium]|nr:CoA transferase [Gammaproteobacteria bacterium]
MSLLQGIRVVELGLWVAGPATAGILADWGAEVVKLEMTSGDPMRRLFSAVYGMDEERCPPFELYNRGKKSLAIDINHAEGLAVVHKLVATADVFVTNMRPKFLARVGLDHETLLARHPSLVYASLTAYGLEGPDADAPGYDMAAFSGRSGIAERATPKGAAPPVLPGGLGDNVTAVTMVAGIAGALFHRQRTGQGQLVSTSLLRAGVYSIGMDVSARLGLGRAASPPPREKPHNPLMNSYRAGDGKWFWLVGAESQRHWPGTLAALGCAELEHDPRFATARERRTNAEELVRIFDTQAATRTRDEWAAIFAHHDVWWAPINSIHDIMTDPQVIASGAYARVPTAPGAPAPETFNAVATPLDFSATPCRPQAPPPAIGGDADALLESLGLDGEARARLRELGVLAPPPGAV